MDVLLFVAGLVTLVLGAHALVHGAVRFAAALGVSSLAIGLTVVAFGTSAPELAVSVRAALAGQPDLSLGNVVGSNIFNTLAILGLTAAVWPVAVHTQFLRLDLWVMIGVSVLMLALSFDGQVSRGDGFLLCAGAAVYTWICFRGGAQPGASDAPGVVPPVALAPAESRAGVLISALAFIAVGLVGLVFGAQWLLSGAVGIAKAAGVSELAIGLTLVAAGTSLPELATSVIAAIRRQNDIALGNIVGSNIFNILGVLGCSAAATSAGVPVQAAAIAWDIPVMVGVAALVVPLAMSERIVSRLEGGVLLAGYGTYVTLLYLQQSGPGAA